MGNVRLLLLTRSLSSAGMKSNIHAMDAMACTAITSAIFLPRQVRGPPLKTGYSAAPLVMSLPSCSHLSGLKESASGPHVVTERPVAHRHHTTMDVLGRKVPSGSVVAGSHCRISKGMGG